MIREAKENGHQLANAFVEPYMNRDDSNVYQVHHGLTKREEFAKAAMQGMLGMPLNPSCGPLHLGNEEDVKTVAKAAVRLADALLEELEATNA